MPGYVLERWPAHLQRRDGAPSARRPRRHRLAARRAQCAERLAAVAAVRDASSALGRRRSRLAAVLWHPSPVSPHRMEEIGRHRHGAVRQRQQGHQRRRRRKGAALISSRHLLDRRRQAQGGRHRQPGSTLSAHRQGLSDRRGDRGVRRHARWQGRRSSAAARSMSPSRRRPRDAAASGANEPVVLLSPACASFDQFQQFRGARRRLPRARRRAARHRA